jgi:serine phosphatase RsbU (regulator of sigma subunit)
VPLGMFAESTYRPGDEIPLEPGDLIVLLTDGVTEAEGEHGESFGMEGPPSASFASISTSRRRRSCAT